MTTMFRRKRIAGAKLQQIRARILARDALCVHCLRKTPPVIRASVEVDHIIPLGRGGTESDSNRQGLCDECHKAKTRRDRGLYDKPLIGRDGWPIEKRQ